MTDVAGPWVCTGASAPRCTCVGVVDPNTGRWSAEEPSDAREAKELLFDLSVGQGGPRAVIDDRFPVGTKPFPGARDELWCCELSLLPCGCSC